MSKAVRVPIHIISEIEITEEDGSISSKTSNFIGTIVYRLKSKSKKRKTIEVRPSDDWIKRWLKK